MSDVLASIAGGAKAMIGMISLRPLAGSSRYDGEALDAAIAHALAQASVLCDAGFRVLMVQNLGDLPVAPQASAVQVAWMTRIAGEVRRASGVPVGLNLLENDADAMLAIASAADLDFVRVKVFVGAMVTPGGLEAGRAFEALRARTTYRAQSVAIFADVHDRTGKPVASAGLAEDLRAAFEIGGADGIVLTGRSHAETLDFLAVANDAVPGRPVLIGGGVTAANIATLAPLASGAIVGSALKHDGHLFADLDPARARAFVAAAASAS